MFCGSNICEEDIFREDSSDDSSDDSEHGVYLRIIKKGGNPIFSREEVELHVY